MDRDKPLLGIAFMLGFCILAPLGDAMAKLIGHAVPLGQVILVRFAVQALIVWPILRRSGQTLRIRGHLLGWVVLRTLLVIGGIGTMVLSLRYLPLADAIAIAYVMPFLLLLLGRVFLDEEVGWRRLAACIVGFCGTLLVMKPSFAEVGWVAALPLVVALDFALYMLVTRRISRAIDPIPLQAATGILGTLMLFPVIVLADGRGWPELDPVTPDLRETVLLGLLGLLGSASHMLMTWSLRFAPASTVAPMQYLEIPFAALFGWLIFAQFPDGLALAGIAIVMGAGLYVILRERTVLRAQARQPLPQGPPSAE
ncbi:DMT family transporter [Tropicimonas sp. IMCC6043]|uniref:DMT family transporter n=1 Tax=Tropicimonas sp. IMCC6043 TaxID=2510645 RepID=UPI00101C9214|nr:DMT family transporter [Tropicimonas sp. IMCC6043]RYH09571.1 DMT family transporter [Tropicimonas sp. IMCC6043]